MTIAEFLSDRLRQIIFQAVCAAAAAVFLLATGTQSGIVIILMIVWFLTVLMAQIWDFCKEKIYLDELKSIMDGLDQRYLFAECVPKPRCLYDRKLFELMRRSEKSKGSVFDVAVDLRSDSETYGKWHGEILTEENKKQFLIPRGFAHGFLVLSDTAEFCYKCDDFYHPNDEGGMAWNDPEIGIMWPGLKGVYSGTPCADGYTVYGVPLNLSDKDQRWLGIRDTFKF